MQAKQRADLAFANGQEDGPSAAVGASPRAETHELLLSWTGDDGIAAQIADLHDPFPVETVMAWRAMRAATRPVAHSLVDALFLTGIAQLCAKRVAHYLGVSRSSLHRLCSQHARCSVKVLISHARAAVAALVLAKTEVRASTAASFLGFADTASLRRLVRLQLGLSVQELRRQIAVDGAGVETTLTTLLSGVECGPAAGRTARAKCTDTCRR